MLPLIVGTFSFSTPAEAIARRVFADATASRSAVVQGVWQLASDEFEFTEEWADPNDVAALRTLLELPATSGLHMNFAE